MLKLLNCLILCVCFVVATAFTIHENNSENINFKALRRVVLDPGHGGHDPGTRGKVAREKDVVLKIALELGQMIEDEYPDVEVYFTRKKDVFIELSERGAFANRNEADLFISIHCNSSPGSSKVNGTETFVMGLHKSDTNLEVAKRENSVILKETNYKQKYKGFDPDSPLAYIMLANYQSAFLASSLTFAQHVEKQFKTKRPSRGVKQAGFLVLWRTSMPAVLIETGFLSNPNEEDYLNSSGGQQEVAQDIFRAFKKYKAQIES